MAESAEAMLICRAPLVLLGAADPEGEEGFGKMIDGVRGQPLTPGGLG